MKKVRFRTDTLLMPVPAVMVSCRYQERDNIITLAWVGVACSDPPLLSLGIRPGRHSYKMIRESGEFVVNIPGERQMEAVDLCGTVSGKEVDKFKQAKLTPLPATEIKAPLIAQCPINLECRLLDVHDLGIHHLFLGEVVAVHVNEDCLIDGKKLDLEQIRPIGYFPGTKEYRGIGEMLGTYGRAH